ncbi:uncharacterized protein LOC128266728 [Drosophila gunungcola]|uniref:uncharacterized protein LOC128266728 n=1 Tax=Drosophila gunungcola TaxID=103775 RepID=UPI0022E7B09C|nr:uncharacterized protein LOC128266728 [Drosophila gunungcola]
MDVRNVEDGLPQSINIVKPDNKDKPFRAVTALIMVILLNACFIAGIILLYLYLNTVNEGTKQRILDFTIVGGALISIPMLYRMGDLSKNRPNFYYI